YEHRCLESKVRLHDLSARKVLRSPAEWLTPQRCRRANSPTVQKSKLQQSRRASFPADETEFPHPPREMPGEDPESQPRGRSPSAPRVASSDRTARGLRAQLATQGNPSPLVENGRYPVVRLSPLPQSLAYCRCQCAGQSDLLRGQRTSSQMLR